MQNRLFNYDSLFLDCNNSYNNIRPILCTFLHLFFKYFKQLKKNTNFLFAGQMNSHTSRYVYVYVCVRVIECVCHVSSLPRWACMFSSPAPLWRHHQLKETVEKSFFPLLHLCVYLCLLIGPSICPRVNILWFDLSPQVHPSNRLCRLLCQLVCLTR